jgi:hypothetical protein
MAATTIHTSCRHTSTRLADTAWRANVTLRGALSLPPLASCARYLFSSIHELLIYAYYSRYVADMAVKES